MEALIAFWSHALCAAGFLALLIWRIAAARQQDEKLLLAGFAVTACWAWLGAILPGDPIVSYAETARNLVWIGLLYSLSPNEGRQHGVRLVYAAVAAVLGFQLVVTSLRYAVPTSAVADTATLLRITAAAGALVLVHNLYGQASPSSRLSIRHAMLALSLTWSYDLNLYTTAYLGSRLSPDLYLWRGLIIALTAPLFALAARRPEGWRIRLSRAATFQSLSLLAICGYFVLMAILATAMRGADVQWARSLLVVVLAAMTIAAMVFLPSTKARSWARVKISKHFFEHRYDYRTEWLRFTATLGSAGPDAAPLGQRVVKAFADVLEAPGGLLLAADTSGAITTQSSWNWPGRNPPASELDHVRDFWSALESTGRIIELDALRGGWAKPEDCVALAPQWMLEEAHVWTGIPLIHNERLVGLILGGFRPSAHGWPAGRQHARRGLWPRGAFECAAIRGVQPALRLHPARHQEPRQPAFFAVAQRGTARRQSGVPGGHGGHAAQLRGQDERVAREASAASPGQGSAHGGSAAAAHPS